MVANILHLIGYASGIAGADVHAGDGPLVLQKSPYLKELSEQAVKPIWEKIITSDSSSQVETHVVQMMSEQLANEVSRLIRENKKPIVIGGDHTSAIGTWSGAYDAIHDKGEMGLIWIDAHMDSHTPETSETGRLHGMPLAVIFGHGFENLTSILHAEPKLKPENVCLIGIRSYEKGEAEFLKKLNVRIYFMEEVKQRGLKSVLEEALQIVKAGTVAYGVTLDIDSIDPEEAPGVDVPEPDGIHAQDLLSCLPEIVSDSKLIAMEIVEFDPTRDKDQQTEKLIVKLLKLIATTKS